VVRERRKHASRSPISVVLTVRVVKTKLQETQSLRIEGCFFVWAVDAGKVCHLCKQEMLVIAGYAEYDSNRVVSIIIALSMRSLETSYFGKKNFIMSQ